MGRINTNISSLQTFHTLQKNNADLATHLQRLSTGLKINAGKDAPAGLIASETLRSEINGINQAIDNSQRANNVVNTAEGALSEVSSLLLEVQGLTIQAANTGALSKEEIQANQLQADIEAEQEGRFALRKRFDARDDETMGAFVERLATERDAATARAERAEADKDLAGTIVDAHDIARGHAERRTIRAEAAGAALLREVEAGRRLAESVRGAPVAHGGAGHERLLSWLRDAVRQYDDSVRGAR